MDSEIARDGLAPGMTLGSYRIERLLGRGGMGAVYLAFDTTLYRQVALKVTTDSTGSETSRTRLLHEARNAAALNHPHICAIYDVGEAIGSAFIAMEYVEGRTLRDRLNHGALPLDEVVRYGTQAADALAYAHARGVVHRDFKAANVIVNEAGQLKVVDFGLARRRDEAMVGATTMASLAPAGSLAGTPYAMAPEQVRGEMTDARTDVWALGVLLHEMVSGATPFGARTTPELFSSILRDAPAPLEGPAAFDRIVRRCLAKEPGDRFQTMTELKSALEQCARESGAVKDVASQSSIAVLPFADMSAGHDHEWFSDGMRTIRRGSRVGGEGVFVDTRERPNHWSTRRTGHSRRRHEPGQRSDREAQAGSGV